MSNQMAAANVHKEFLDSSVEFADVLKVFATIIEIECGKQLFYMVDQVEALSKITNKNAEARWVETLRACPRRSQPEHCSGHRCFSR